MGGEGWKEEGESCEKVCVYKCFCVEMICEDKDATT